MRVRRFAPLAALVLAPLLLTACSGDEQDAQDNPPVGVVRSDQVNILNATVVTDGEGVGTLVATLVNEAPESDTLTDVEIVTDDGRTETLLPDGPIDVPTDGIIRLAPDQRVITSGEGLRAGYFVEISYAFKNASTLRDVIPVRFTEAEFSDIEVPTQEEFDAAG